MVIREKGKLRDLVMVFKSSFKCLKNKKMNLLPAILKLETLLYQNIYIYYFILYYIRRAILIQKKKWSYRSFVIRSNPCSNRPVACEICKGLYLSYNIQAHYELSHINCSIPEKKSGVEYVLIYFSKIFMIQFYTY